MSARRPPDPDDDRLAEELVLLVDGGLEPEHTRALEARAEGDPELAARIARVRAGREHLHTAAESVEASFDLRRRIEALHTSRTRARWRPLAWLTAAGAAAAVLLVLVLGPGTPGVDQVIALAERAPVAAVSAGGGPLLADEVEGVHYPDYFEKFGWKAVGRRDDEVDGRDVTTVFYEKDGRRVAYSIVAGDPLEEPAGEDIEAEGTRLRRAGDGNAVTWRRQGHTCVMSGDDGVALDEIAELAGWKAKGEVPF
jgi:anti-sigma factor RsiW